ncbi:hypothetical protein GCM10027416_00090 [Okibacterium endophyticum]
MRNTSTRLLLTCAAIGVAGGLVFIGSSYIDILIASTLPVVYGVLVGVYFLPGVIAQSLLRRGGVAVLSGFVAGLVSGTFTPPLFFVYLATGVGVGVLQEVPFLIGRYRYWKPWVFYLTAVIAGALFGGGVMYAMGFEKHTGWFAAVYFGLFALSPLLFTWLGRVVAHNLDKTGVARGLQHEIDTRRTSARNESALMSVTA